MILESQKRSGDTITLLHKLSKELENACSGKVSTGDITPERLLWEIFNKVFTILVTCENALITKDSLTAHLVARYTYEMLIVFAYIFLDKSKTQERAKQFLQFNQFKNTERMWTDKTYAQMLDSLPSNSRFTTHKKHYRNLSNFAHPTMDSFLLNRRGQRVEFLMMIGTILLTVATVLEIIRICFEENLYFDEEKRAIIDLAGLSFETDRLMTEGRMI